MVKALFAAAGGRVTLIAFALLVAATLALYLVNPKNEIKRDLGADYVATDSTFLYETSAVTKMLGRYRPEHYSAHESFVRVYDFVYPPFYAIPCALVLAYFFPVLFPGRGGGLRWLVLLPLAAMAFDYAENFTMLSFLRSYRADPLTPLTTLEVSRAFTNVKLLLLLVSDLVLLVFGALALIRLRRSLESPRPRGD
ncbi:MAG: hypothetical protein LC795_16650 [Acidobacteria bacterium]|nr:hypothetical protein [Acidobacteriota bacterium]